MHTRSEPLCELWVKVMHQCECVSCDQRTALVGDADNEGGCVHAGAAGG